MFFIRLKSRVIGNKSCDFDPLLVEYLREGGGKSLDRPTVVQPHAARVSPLFSRVISRPAFNRAVCDEHIVQKTFLNYFPKIYVTMKVRIDRIGIIKMWDAWDV
jgi:hypothetical protein